MGRLRQINLEDIPWPISILKFNQAVSEMTPGDRMVVFLKDADVMTNLQQLLRHQPDVKVTTSTSGGELCVEIEKRGPVISRSAATDSHRYR